MLNSALPSFQLARVAVVGEVVSSLLASSCSRWGITLSSPPGGDLLRIGWGMIEVDASRAGRLVLALGPRHRSRRLPSRPVGVALFVNLLMAPVSDSALCMGYGSGGGRGVGGWLSIVTVEDVRPYNTVPMPRTSPCRYLSRLLVVVMVMCPCAGVSSPQPHRAVPVRYYCLVSPLYLQLLPLKWAFA